MIDLTIPYKNVMGGVGGGGRDLLAKFWKTLVKVKDLYVYWEVNIILKFEVTKNKLIAQF